METVRQWLVEYGPHAGYYDRVTKEKIDRGSIIGSNDIIQLKHDNIRFYNPKLIYHRLDGPAIINAYYGYGNTAGFYSFYVHGKYLGFFSRNKQEGEIPEWALQNGIDLANMTEDDKNFMRLSWS